MEATYGRARRSAAGPAAVLATAVLLAVPGPAEAHNVYFDFELPLGLTGTGLTPLYAVLYPFLPEEMPSKHEEFVYRAIGEACGAAGDPVECAFYEDSWNDCPFGVGCESWTNCGLAALDDIDDCHDIGYTSSSEGGYERTDFRSLLVGVRFVDMRERSGFELPAFNSFADYMAAEGLGIGRRPWYIQSSAGWQFPAQHAYGIGRMLEDKRLYKHEWTTDATGHHRPVAGLAERNQAVLTAAASFLFDRFLQAQPSSRRSALLPVTDMSTVRASMRENWRAGMFITALSMLVSGDPVGAEVQRVAGEAVDRYDAYSNVLGWMVWDCAMFACIGLMQLNFLRDAVLSDDTGEGGSNAPGEQLLVRPDLFYIGQGAHTIADSFAHTMRDYANIVDPDGPGESLGVAAVRTDVVGGFLFNHSGAADHNGEFFYLDQMWSWDDTAGDADMFGDEYRYGTRIRDLGYANKQYGADATRDWLRVFYDPPGGRSFDERLAALKRFIKEHLAFEYPQELAPESGYRKTEPCRFDEECADAFDEDGGTPAVCDFFTRLCRRQCDEDKPCRPGFTCSSAVFYGRSGPGPRRYCNAL